MPKQKSFDERYRILDELLHQRRGYSTKQLKAEIEARLEELYGEDEEISENTIRNDIQWIKDTYGDVIVESEDVFDRRNKPRSSSASASR